MITCENNPLLSSLMRIEENSIIANDWQWLNKLIQKKEFYIRMMNDNKLSKWYRGLFKTWFRQEVKPEEDKYNRILAKYDYSFDANGELHIETKIKNPVFVDIGDKRIRIQ